MHPLATYLQTSRRTQAEFGRASGVTQSRVTQYLTGQEIPEDRCAAMEIASNGALRCEALRPDVEWTRDEDGRVIGYHRRLIDPVTPAERAVA